MRRHNDPVDTIRLRRSRLSGEQTRRLLEHFVAGTPARTVAELVGVNRNTATQFYHRLRETIAARLAGEDPLVADAAAEVEAGEYVFGRAGNIGRGRCGPGKVPVFGLLRRGGRMQTEMLPDMGREALVSMLKARLRADAIVYSDRLDVAAALASLGIRHRPVLRGARTPAGRAHIRGIENFWSQAERHLRKYNGIPAHHFRLFLKECEWRFNYGSPKQLLESLTRWLVETR
jgi:transposase